MNDTLADHLAKIKAQSTHKFDESLYLYVLLALLLRRGHLLVHVRTDHDKHAIANITAEIDWICRALFGLTPDALDLSAPNASDRSRELFSRGSSSEQTCQAEIAIVSHAESLKTAQVQDLLSNLRDHDRAESNDERRPKLLCIFVVGISATIMRSSDEFYNLNRYIVDRCALGLTATARPQTATNMATSQLPHLDFAVLSRMEEKAKAIYTSLEVMTYISDLLSAVRYNQLLDGRMVSNRCNRHVIRHAATLLAIITEPKVDALTPKHIRAIFPAMITHRLAPRAKHKDILVSWTEPALREAHLGEPITNAQISLVLQDLLNLV
ncbi:uncharacterized protein L969DRAFT_96690 [Mixia osmundae IAM 14324]|uniref:Magnesium chelatase n=1 Tax=Mixia osmundae (strain CBS 9802 / IAM 14324 / JCM 22182 / KY 12970) TaxID=764103 RepID=G7DSV6_MIXOS|nr:uncharacterized protein L969DRAFT_96690 [Mixia osmundae IAM 14324]KEI37122.1 hypothetical protein L969DRAFT_96690 [Mixia osmundae IAM 14324]GAA93666.1 hypothetical protein E5Q_00311 [Mixia osmundae IAM 14324]